MNYYLVDFENVRTDGIKDLVEVQENDAMIIFYSEQCKNITLDVIDSIIKLKIQLSTYKAKVGRKNALDFQLSSYLGYLIGKGGVDAVYHIVSNDKGYDCLCDYWQEQNIKVDRISKLDGLSLQETVPIEEKVSAPAPEPKKKESKVKSSDLATIDEIKVLLSEEDEPEAVLMIFNQYKTKQAICNSIAKQFKDSKKTSTVYKKLKPLFKEKNKS
jgi:hypothetical protein